MVKLSNTGHKLVDAEGWLMMTEMKMVLTSCKSCILVSLVVVDMKKMESSYKSRSVLELS